MPKINMNTPIKNMSGNIIKDENNKELLIRNVLTTSLLSVQKNDENIDGKKKYEMYKLANKIDEAKDVIDLESEDIILLKERVSKSYLTYVMGQVWDILEDKK
jgi:hypothetical protein